MTCHAIIDATLLSMPLPLRNATQFCRLFRRVTVDFFAADATSHLRHTPLLFRR